ncbi:DUF2975 domain-containing protein [Clostridium hydrogeniformans]|uniref:DUF2975 domain-containing protein n=1 Tax=Clostridium hydrogeniformans TaxID=349933 RepID=UPI0004839EA6|nr:DUF2975 domain-containing protein [Clostridium hydrogeniformans]
MKYYGKGSLSTLIKLSLDLAMIVGFIVAILTLKTTYMEGTEILSTPKKILILSLLIIGITCVFLIVLGLRKVLITLESGDPFVHSNVKALSRISYECFIIALCYILNTLFSSDLKEFKFIYVDSKGVHTDMEFIIFIFAGLFILILSKVFKKAVEYKEENEFTI